MTNPENMPEASEAYDPERDTSSAEAAVNPMVGILVAKLDDIGEAYTVSTSSGPHPTTFIEGEWGTLVVYADGNFRYTNR